MVMTPVPPTPSITMSHGPAERRRCGQGDAERGRRRGRPAQFAALHGDEARADSLQTREVGIAGRLVDLALAPERRLDRADRGAARLFDAIAAALADPRVDERAHRRRDRAGAWPARFCLTQPGQYMTAETLGISRNSRWISSIASRWRTLTPRSGPPALCGVRRPRRRSRCARRLRGEPRAICATLKPPSTAVRRSSLSPVVEQGERHPASVGDCGANGEAAG